jgi:hypothetical protein
MRAAVVTVPPVVPVPAIVRSSRRRRWRRHTRRGWRLMVLLVLRIMLAFVSIRRKVTGRLRSPLRGGIRRKWWQWRTRAFVRLMLPTIMAPMLELPVPVAHVLLQLIH